MAIKSNTRQRLRAPRPFPPSADGRFHRWFRIPWSYSHGTSRNIRSERAIPRLQLDKLPVRAWNDGNTKTKKKVPRRKPSLRQMQAATRIQACFRGYHCRMAYRIKHDKLRRRADARTRLGVLSPFLNARPERFPRISTRTAVQGRQNQAAATHKQDSETSFLRTQLTDREEELMEELKSLNQALEARRKAHAAPRLPLLVKTTSFGA
ncbi:hypothetical protein SPRG_17515 [Saprolegnia parasitica CBS 223.65]|uniref:Uncharacterized protein n=1 Tax=Saprolegnia parasitica (strain CBS 223.65) TaxID=695850 RepID=A0A067BK00_SAPPC|nr:hypothetical protein SPRG_17515 [Saprolegnia parasitica CBS 223.65]KDO17060.1 hypothetical protein SPRG_17515 [Saprolegnia parasitica CBS 223.65]|eukprot:XP_012212231.1 hypothetical protein SPRG_17515 [Saprolegnia parasitica CBS 223.65]